ncbi:pantetheine-phosphate adenylyltransferase [Propionibacterium australiense]|uniref:Phosphopantetheine adenylyltransferase n=1 Tax=Propionibacterium australiense TaxID=119981 RepID=A0A383S892_9ACTN|nr:pantetheine-phosphate adenylyltransferase [Propionibacterium australiense]RLP06785.1 pantetheine-phosphate adenylyltransferase [Propionibacterium australiense]RLP06951.1 pantetheine-phosphate adenylyltransferase [Propionibacterium australiense]SYZ34053.1 pantetheine-phosphate adenylyltransferase [Propionibacterium australiense]VEH92107.1 Phosphopantetheine adenylyltransferase [Propionibacterium australiense]
MPKPVRAVVPGSFDPITLGHLDIITRAHDVFNEVIVAVGRNTTKNYLFDLDERLALVRDAVSGLSGVSVEPIDALLVDFCRAHDAAIIVKGVRFGSDFDYELQMSQLNRVLSGVETVLLPAGHDYGTISSTLLREVAANNGDISRFVTPAVHEAVLRKNRS